MLPEVSYPGRVRVPYPYLDLVIVIVLAALCLGLLLLDIERTLLRIANVLEQAQCGQATGNR